MATKNDKKRSFVMYDSFLEAMRHLNDADFRECVNKIRDYALEGIDEESASPNVNIIMTLAKPNLDSARRRYEACVENGKKGAEYGKDGGAPKGNKNASKKQPQEQPLKQPLDVNVEENENVNVYVEVDENENVEVNVNAEGGQSPTTATNTASTSEKLKISSTLTSSSPSNGAVISTHTSTPTSVSGKEKANGYSYSEYYQMCINSYLEQLVNIKLNNLPNDDRLFWRAVDTYKYLYNIQDNKKAIQDINEIVDDVVRMKRVPDGPTVRMQ